MIADDETEIAFNRYQIGTYPSGYDVIPVTDVEETHISPGQLEITTQGG